jgi:hypothetical protein
MAAAAAFLSPVQAAEKTKTQSKLAKPRLWLQSPGHGANVLRGKLEIILKGERCSVLLQAPAEAARVGCLT